MSRSTTRPRRTAGLLPLGVAVAVGLAGCGGDSRASDTPSVDPTEAAWQTQLDELPTVDGADRTAREVIATGLTETFAVPAGAPACLQVLARLDAGGYEVVAGAASDAVDPTTCRSADPADGVTTDAGTATILARGGSQVTLTWTTTDYTVTASET